MRGEGPGSPIHGIGCHARVEIQPEHQPRPIALELGHYPNGAWLELAATYMTPAEARALAATLVRRAKEAELISP